MVSVRVCVCVSSQVGGIFGKANSYTNGILHLTARKFRLLRRMVPYMCTATYIPQMQKQKLRKIVLLATVKYLPKIIYLYAKVPNI